GPRGRHTLASGPRSGRTVHEAERIQVLASSNGPVCRQSPRMSCSPDSSSVPERVVLGRSVSMPLPPCFVLRVPWNPSNRRSYGQTPHEGCVPPRAASTDPGEDRERPECDHLTRPTDRLNRERGRSLVRMLRVPFGRGRGQVRLHRVEDPPPVGPLLLAKEVERVPEPTVLPIAERGQTVEANQEVVVVVDGPVESVPRLVPLPLHVEFVLEVVLRAPFHAVLHRRGPLGSR